MFSARVVQLRSVSKLAAGLALALCAHTSSYGQSATAPTSSEAPERDRKSTRLNSSHLGISYADFCLKKKLNLPFKALMFLTLMRPSLVLFLVLWLKLVKDFLKVRCRLALLPFLISCLIWLDLVASLPLIKERILVIILLVHFTLSLLDALPI